MCRCRICQELYFALRRGDPSSDHIVSLLNLYENEASHTHPYRAEISNCSLQSLQFLVRSQTWKRIELLCDYRKYNSEGESEFQLRQDAKYHFLIANGYPIKSDKCYMRYYPHIRARDHCHKFCIIMLGLKKRQIPKLINLDRFVVRLIAFDVWITRDQLEWNHSNVRVSSVYPSILFILICIAAFFISISLQHK